MRYENDSRCLAPSYHELVCAHIWQTPFTMYFFLLFLGWNLCDLGVWARMIILPGSDIDGQELTIDVSGRNRPSLLCQLMVYSAPGRLYLL